MGINPFDLKRKNGSLTEKMIEVKGQLFTQPRPIMVHIIPPRPPHAGKY